MEHVHIKNSVYMWCLGYLVDLSWSERVKAYRKRKHRHSYRWECIKTSHATKTRTVIWCRLPPKRHAVIHRASSSSAYRNCELNAFWYRKDACCKLNQGNARSLDLHLLPKGEPSYKHVFVTPGCNTSANSARCTNSALNVKHFGCCHIE